MPRCPPSCVDRLVGSVPLTSHVGCFVCRLLGPRVGHIVGDPVGSRVGCLVGFVSLLAALPYLRRRRKNAVGTAAYCSGVMSAVSSAVFWCHVSAILSAVLSGLVSFCRLMSAVLSGVMFGSCLASRNACYGEHPLRWAERSYACHPMVPCSVDRMIRRAWMRRCIFLSHVGHLVGRLLGPRVDHLVGGPVGSRVGRLVGAVSFCCFMPAVLSAVFSRHVSALFSAVLSGLVSTVLSAPCRFLVSCRLFCRRSSRATCRPSCRRSCRVSCRPSCRLRTVSSCVGYLFGSRLGTRVGHLVGPSCRRRAPRDKYGSLSHGPLRTSTDPNRTDPGSLRITILRTLTEHYGSFCYGPFRITTDVTLTGLDSSCSYGPLRTWTDPSLTDPYGSRSKPLRIMTDSSAVFSGLASAILWRPSCRPRALCVSSRLSFRQSAMATCQSCRAVWSAPDPYGHVRIRV